MKIISSKNYRGYRVKVEGSKYSLFKNKRLLGQDYDDLDDAKADIDMYSAYEDEDEPSIDEPSIDDVDEDSLEDTESDVKHPIAHQNTSKFDSLQLVLDGIKMTVKDGSISIEDDVDFNSNENGEHVSEVYDGVVLINDDRINEEIVSQISKKNYKIDDGDYEIHGDIVLYFEITDDSAELDSSDIDNFSYVKLK